jgi:hypothetical protein
MPSAVAKLEELQCGAEALQPRQYQAAGMSPVDIPFYPDLKAPGAAAWLKPIRQAFAAVGVEAIVGLSYEFHGNTGAAPFLR